MMMICHDDCDGDDDDSMSWCWRDVVEKNATGRALSVDLTASHKYDDEYSHYKDDSAATE